MSAFPDFAPGEHRQLLADVHRWARTNGWNWRECWGWVNALYASEATLAVDWDTDTRTITVHRANGNAIFRPTTYPADTVCQAVDVLVAYGVLPAQFSSAYDEGRAELKTENDELRRQILRAGVAR